MYFSLVSLTLLSHLCFQSFDLLQKECAFISSEWQRHFLHLPVESWSYHSLLVILSFPVLLPESAHCGLASLGMIPFSWACPSPLFSDNTFSCSFMRRLTTLLQQQLLLNSSAFCYGGIFPLNSFARVFFFFLSDCISMLSYHLAFVSSFIETLNNWCFLCL